MRPRRMRPAFFIAMLAFATLATVLVSRAHLPPTDLSPPLATPAAAPELTPEATTTAPQTGHGHWPAFDADPPADAYSQRFQSRLDRDLRAAMAADSLLETLELHSVTCRATRCLVKLRAGADASSLTLSRLVAKGLVSKGYAQAPFHFDAATGFASMLVDMQHDEAPAGERIETSVP